MSYDPDDPYGKKYVPQLPGNFGGETFREYCGLSRQRRRGKRHFKDPGVSAQDLYRAIGRHS